MIKLADELGNLISRTLTAREKRAAQDSNPALAFVPPLVMPLTGALTFPAGQRLRGARHGLFAGLGTSSGFLAGHLLNAYLARKGLMSDRGLAAQLMSLAPAMAGAIGGAALSGSLDKDEGQKEPRRQKRQPLDGDGDGRVHDGTPREREAPRESREKQAAGGVEEQILGDWPAVADPNDPLQVEALPQLQRGLQRQFPGFRMTQRLWNRTLPLLREEQRMRNAGPQEGPGASHQFNLDRAGNELELMHGLGIPLRRSPYERVGPLPDAPRPPHLRWEVPPSGPPNFAPMGPPSGPPNFDPQDGPAPPAFNPQDFRKKQGAAAFPSWRKGR